MAVDLVPSSLGATPHESFLVDTVALWRRCTRFPSGPDTLPMDFLAWKGQQQMSWFECGMSHSAVFGAPGLQLVALLSKTVGL